MNSPELDDNKLKTPLALSAISLAGANIALRWPGSLTPDSKSQLSQAVSGSITDWHPPIMAKLWALLGGSIPAMLIVQVGLLWLGLWALAETLRREQAGKWAWAMLAIGLSPICLKYTGVIQKDSLLASFFIAASAWLH